MRVFTLNQIGRHELDVIQMAVAVEHLHETEFMRGHFRPTEYTQHLAQFERVVTGGAFDASALPHHQFRGSKGIRPFHESAVVHTLVVFIPVGIVFLGIIIPPRSGIVLRELPHLLPTDSGIRTFQTHVDRNAARLVV